MESRFEDRAEEYIDEVGRLSMKGTLVIDQHYALDQHENLGYRHENGGGPKFLIGPLMTHLEDYMTQLENAVPPNELREAFIACLEHWSTLMDPAAPIDDDPNPIRLRRSGQPILEVDGTEVYHRPPDDPREPMDLDDGDDYDSDGFRDGGIYGSLGV